MAGRGQPGIVRIDVGVGPRIDVEDGRDREEPDRAGDRGRVVGATRVEGWGERHRTLIICQGQLLKRRVCGRRRGPGHDDGVGFVVPSVGVTVTVIVVPSPAVRSIWGPESLPAAIATVDDGTLGVAVTVTERTAWATEAVYDYSRVKALGRGGLCSSVAPPERLSALSVLSVAGGPARVTMIM